METITFKTNLGEDGILTIPLPSNLKNTELEITIVYQPINSSNKVNNNRLKEWQKGFFEEVIGSWEGEPLVRQTQPEGEEREELL